ncbi:MAG: response regulator [Deltaproteobacteria bacterium]|nr:response regulator [Deltaproteobacteria bacterium]
MELKAPAILVVDDELLNVKLMVQILQKEEYKISIAMNGEEAWNLLQKTPEDFDAVLLDRMMPGIDGLEVLKRMKEHDVLSSVPVIFQTAMTEEDEILEGIQAGAFYYLTKPYRREKLLAVVKTAVTDHAQYKSLLEDANQTIDALNLLTRGWFELKSLDEVDNLAALLAKICPEPDKVVLGLWELLINAIEHGNLGITYEEKSELLTNDLWRDEVNRRIRLPENRSKKVVVEYERSNEEICFLIEDQGNGFNWKPFLEFSPDRVFDTHGRGIAMAGNYSFDRIQYIGKGNKVMAVICCDSKPG